MTANEFGNQTETHPDVLARAADALALHIFANHAAEGFVSLNGVLEDRDIPFVIRRFLDLELRFSIRRTLQHIRASFQVRPELETPAIQTLTAGLILSGRVPAEQFQSFLENTLAITHEYLVHPQNTLVSLLTAGETEAEIDKRFFEILDHAAAYGHLPDVARAWAQRQKAEGIEQVTSLELTALFAKIDRSILSNLSLSQLRTVIDPLFEFYWIGAEANITSTTLEYFFEDRGMTKARMAIADSEILLFSSEQLQKLLKELLSNSQSGSTNVVAPVQEVFRKSGADDEARDTSYEEFIHELRSAGVAILAPGHAASAKQTLTAPPDEFLPSSDEPKEEMRISMAPSLSFEDSSELSEEFSLATDERREVPRKIGTTPLMEQLITPKDRKKYIEKVFEDNATDYERFLALINQSETWKQASVYVDAIFLRHKINPYSKHAVRFTDTVYSRFLRQD